MRTQLFAVVMGAMSMVAVAGCAPDRSTWAGPKPPAPPAAATQPPKVSPAPPKGTKIGRRWTVAILRFGDTKQIDDVPFGPAMAPSRASGTQVSVDVAVSGTGQPSVAGDAPPQINKRARDILKHALVKSDSFVVVERERILEIIREINFGKSPYADPRTAPDKGHLLCVRYLIEGSIGVNEDKTLKDNLEAEPSYRNIAAHKPGLWNNVFTPGKVNRTQMRIALRQVEARRARDRVRQEFPIACYLSAYDVRTGVVTTTVMGLGANGLEAIEDAVGELSESLDKNDGSIQVAAVYDGNIYIDAGEKAGLKVGDHFRIIHMGEPIHGQDGQTIGYAKTDAAEIEILDVQPLMSIGKKVRGSGTIARGDLAKSLEH